MFSYERIDCVADMYIPVLFAVLVGFYVLHGMRTNKINLVAPVILAIVSIALVYFLGFVDERYKLWMSFSADYSTHTALSIVLVASIAPLLVSCARIAVLLSFILYLLLMRYQQYHSWLDMLSTVAVFLPLLLAMFLLRARLFKIKPNKKKNAV